MEAQWLYQPRSLPKGTMSFDKVIFNLCMKLRQFGRLQVCRLLGTVSNEDGSYKAWIDLLERSYIMRAELNAVVSILIEKGIATPDEIQAKMAGEMSDYVDELAKKWPEVEVEENGFTIKDIQAFAARSKRENWPP